MYGVRDLVALPVDDHRGAGRAAVALPLVLGGMLAAVLITRMVRGMMRRAICALAFAVTGGLVMAAILTTTGRHRLGLQQIALLKTT